MSDESRSDSGDAGLIFDQFCDFMRAGEYYEQDPNFGRLDISTEVLN